MSERRLFSLHTNNLQSSTVQSLRASAPVKTGKWELPAWEVREDGWGGGSEQNGAGTLTPANNSELLLLLEV